MQMAGPVQQFFRNNGLASEQAADLAQVVFLRAFTRLHALRSEDSAPTWIFRIAANTFKNHLREQSAAKRGAATLSLDQLTSPDEVMFHPLFQSPPENAEQRVLTRESRDRTLDALQALPPRAKQVVMMRLQGLKFGDIAEILNISTNAVKSHFHQAKQRLRSLLAQSNGI